MKVGDLVFSHGSIAIIVDVYDWKHTGQGLRGKRFLRLYYFRYDYFGNSTKCSVVPVSDDIR